MLHTLGSTFTTCACGSRSKDCVLQLMEAFVDCELPPTPPNAQVDLGPLVGRRRGFRTREKVPFSGGLTGVEMVTSEPMSRATSSSSTDSEPHGRLLDGDTLPQPAIPSTPKPSTSRKRRHDGSIRGGKGSSSGSDADPSGGFYRSGRVNVIHTYVVVTPRQRQKRRIGSRVTNSDPQNVDQRAMPAKMRKQWIHRTVEESTPRPIRADEASGTEEEHIDIGHGNSILSITVLRQSSWRTYQTRLSCPHPPCPHAVSERRQRKHQLLRLPHPHLHLQ